MFDVLPFMSVPLSRPVMVDLKLPLFVAVCARLATIIDPFLAFEPPDGTYDKKNAPEVPELEPLFRLISGGGPSPIALQTSETKSAWLCASIIYTIASSDAMKNAASAHAFATTQMSLHAAQLTPLHEAGIRALCAASVTAHLGRPGVRSTRPWRGVPACASNRCIC